MFPLTPSLDRSDQDGRTVDLFSAEGGRILDVLGSETTRAILGELRQEPGTTSTVADRIDTSVQNAHYHIERLDDAGLVEVIGTHYSSRGTEMDVYAPAYEPLCLVGGDGNAHRTTREHTDAELSYEVSD